MTEDLFPEQAAAAKQAAIEADDRLREREADFTPRLVVRAILAWFAAHVLRFYKYRPIEPGCTACDYLSAQTEHTCPEPTDWLMAQQRGSVLSRPAPAIRILDICAGAGVWASEARRLFGLLGIDVYIVAVEIDKSEAVYLKRHADEVVIGDWREYVAKCKKRGEWFDLVIGNPAFSEARAPKTSSGFDVYASMPAVLMDIAGATILYMTQQSWTKTQSGYLVREKFPPAFSVDVPGSVAHRVGKNPRTGKRYSADSIPYSASMWIGKFAGPYTGLTKTGMLSPLEGRSWIEDLRPGAEPTEWLVAEGIPFLEAA